MGMKITAAQIAERYASMTDEELQSLDPGKLTPEAATLRAEELARRGAVESPAMEEERASRERETEKRLARSVARRRLAVALAVAALLTELALPRVVELPRAATGALVAAFCVLAIYVWRRRA